MMQSSGKFVRSCQQVLALQSNQMQKCEHGQKISRFCITEHCLHREAAGCEYCMKKYHFHLANTRILSDQDILQLLKTLNQVPDVKPKNHKMTQAACEYIKAVKQTVNSWLDAAQKAISEKLSYPFLKKKDLLNVYLRVKNRDFRKVASKDLRNFHSCIQEMSFEEIAKQEQILYQQEIDWTWTVLESVDELSKSIGRLSPLKEEEGRQQLPKSPKCKQLYEAIKNEISLNNGTSKRAVKPDSLRPPTLTMDIPKQSALSLEGSTIMKNRLMKDSIQSEKGLKNSLELRRDDPTTNFKESLFAKYQNEKKEKEVLDRKLLGAPTEEKPRRFSIDDRIKSKRTESKGKLSEMEVSDEAEATEEQKYYNAHINLPEPPPVLARLQFLGKKQFTFEMAQKTNEEEIQSPILKKKREMKGQKKSGFGINLNQIQPSDVTKDSSVPSCQEEQSANTEKIELEQNEKNSLLLFGEAIKADGQKAVQLLKVSLIYSPRNLSAAEYLSFLYIEGGRAKECLEVCQKVIQMIAHTPEEYECSLHIHNNRAAALNMLGRYSESITLLQQCLRHRRKHYFYKNLADAYFHLNIPQKAVMNYEKAVCLDPGFDEAFYNLAVTQFILQEYASAEFNIRKALKMDESNQSYLELKEQILLRIQQSQV